MTPSSSDSSEESVMIPLGNFKASKVGNNWKVSIPKFVSDNWDLAGEKQNENDDFESNVVFLYGKEIHGRTCLVISKTPLPGDPVLMKW